jgi:hypothetical protein
MSRSDIFGTLPAYGFFIRHAKNVVIDNIEVRFDRPDTRPAYVLRDVTNADIHHSRADQAPGAPTVVLDNVDQFTITSSRPVADTHLDHVSHKEL